jgi:hypothetical protein
VDRGEHDQAEKTANRDDVFEFRGGMPFWKTKLPAGNPGVKNLPQPQEGSHYISGNFPYGLLPTASVDYFCDFLPAS